MAARGRRQPFNLKAGFRNQDNEPKDSSAALERILKQARQSGQINLSDKGFAEVPPSVWRINIDVPEESRNISLDNTEDRWWDQVELTKVILASNVLTSISEDIQQLPALTVLDVHDNKLTSLPQALASLRNLQKLHLSHNNLKSLPDCIVGLENLHYLFVDHNELEELNPHIGQLKVLEELNVSNNRLACLPQSIGFLNNLFKLNVSNNQIQVIPHDVGSMTSLRFLDCTHNQIHTISDELGQLRQLEQLYLRHNRLTHLPLLHSCVNLKELHLGNNNIRGLTEEHLNTLKSVSFLDLRDNRLSKIPDEITLLHDLERLDLTNNDISQLPYVLGNMTKLKALVLDGNPLKSIRRDIIMRGTTEVKKYLRSRIEEPESKEESVVRPVGGSTGIIGGAAGDVDAHEVMASKSISYSGKKSSTIPDEIWEMAVNSKVKVLNLSKNVLTTWPERLCDLGTSLTELHLGFNKISAIPASVSSLQSLLFLDLRNNQLSDLPSELSSIPRLREIVLARNRLTAMPSVLYALSSVEIVLASDNQISSIDAAQVQKMSQLATLDLQNNNISQVPPELGLCTQLRSLQLEGNPFRVPRPAILAKGTLALLDYLRGRIAS